MTIGGLAPQDEAGELTVAGDAATSLGRGVAEVLRYLIAVLDREDRLESGSGGWLDAFRSDQAAQREAIREGVLRALTLAVDPVNFRILEALASSGSIATDSLVETAGVGELPLGHRIGDLVSAGLATKQPEANQVAATAAGNGIVALVGQAVAAGATLLERDLQ